MGWMKKSAEQGYPAAQFKLGKAYLLGEDVRKNKAKGEELILKAAEQGDIDAMTALAKCYHRR